jgi:hypothetical protein
MELKNINTIIKDINENPIFRDKDCQEPATFKTLLIDCLVANYADEKDLSGQEKFNRFQLAQKIINADEIIDLPVEEVSKLKHLIGKAYSTIVVGRMFLFLEGN